MNANFAAAVHQTDLQKITNKVPVPAAVSSNSGAFDCDTGSVFRRTLDGTNGILSLSNVSVNQIIVIELLQDGTGSRTVTWFGGITWGGGGTVPVLTTTINKKDKFIIECISAGVYEGHIVDQNI